MPVQSQRKDDWKVGGNRESVKYIGKSDCNTVKNICMIPWAINVFLVNQQETEVLSGKIF